MDKNTEQPTLGMDSGDSLAELPSVNDEEGLLENEIEGDKESDDDEPTEGDGDDDEPTEGDGDDEQEEVEYEGKKYKLPKELKGALERHKDYTQKTQALAEQRRVVAARETVAQEREMFSVAATQNIARIHNLQSQVEQFSSVDWQAAAAANPVEAQKAYFAYQQAREQLANEQKELNEMVEKFKGRTSEARRTAVESGTAELMRDIPNFGPALARELVNYGAKTYGVDAETVAEITEPWLVKALHKAYLYDQANAQQAKPTKAPENITTVRASRSGASKDPSKMSDKEYAEYRRRIISRR